VNIVVVVVSANHSAGNAVRQIKEKQYALRFAPKLGEAPFYTGRILAVGIAYDKKSKKHSCEAEILREKEQKFIAL